jgi:hypothetical protein
VRVPYEGSVALGSLFVDLAPDIADAILLTVEQGWAIAVGSEDVHPAAGEVSMTERLRDGMRAAVNARGASSPQLFFVLPGTESRSQPEQLVPDGRTDIPLFFIEVALRGGDHDPHAIIECKRVSGKDAHLCREYVIEGIDRFRNGLYGARHVRGFMIGYVIVGDEAAAASGVNRYLAGRRRQVDQLQREERNWVYLSHHLRSNGSRIDLHHAFLRVPTHDLPASA